jgi:hypothetical protein
VALSRPIRVDFPPQRMIAPFRIAGSMMFDVRCRIAAKN